MVNSRHPLILETQDEASHLPFRAGPVDLAGHSLHQWGTSFDAFVATSWEDARETFRKHGIVLIALYRWALESMVRGGRGAAAAVLLLLLLCCDVAATLLALLAAPTVIDRACCKCLPQMLAEEAEQFAAGADGRQRGGER